MAYPPVEKDRGCALGAKSFSFSGAWKRECLCLWPRWRSDCQQQEMLEGADYPDVLEVRDGLLVPVNRKPLSLGAPLQLIRWI